MAAIKSARRWLQLPIASLQNAGSNFAAIQFICYSSPHHLRTLIRCPVAFFSHRDDE